jgi:hypothetical protein
MTQVEAEMSDASGAAVVDEGKGDAGKMEDVEEAQPPVLKWDDLKMKQWKDVEEFMADVPYYTKFLEELYIGDMVDVLDLKEKWYPAYITSMKDGRYRVSFQN